MGVDGSPLCVVHRDVSPQNVFVTYEGAVKVLDFGIAKVADSSLVTSTGFVKGKIAYMAPEQAAQAPLDCRADVFSVGAMLWQILAGKRLWDGLSDIQILTHLLMKETPDSPRTVAPDVDPTLEAICLRALAHKREDRYPSAAEASIGSGRIGSTRAARTSSPRAWES